MAITARQDSTKSLPPSSPSTGEFFGLEWGKIVPTRAAVGMLRAFLVILDGNLEW